MLAPEWSAVEAAEVMSALLSIAVWEDLTVYRGWSTEQYIQHMKAVLKRTFVKDK